MSSWKKLPDVFSKLGSSGVIHGVSLHTLGPVHGCLPWLLRVTSALVDTLPH